MLIDTRKAVRDLTEGGTFTEEQADRLIDVVTASSDQVITREDLERTKWQIVSWTVGANTAIMSLLLLLFRTLG